MPRAPASTPRRRILVLWQPHKNPHTRAEAMKRVYPTPAFFKNSRIFRACFEVMHKRSLPALSTYMAKIEQLIEQLYTWYLVPAHFNTKKKQIHPFATTPTVPVLNVHSGRKSKKIWDLDLILDSDVPYIFVRVILYNQVYSYIRYVCEHFWCTYTLCEKHIW